MFKRMKLAAKLSVVLGILLAVIFSILIAVTALLSSAAISGAVSGELTALAKSNGNQVQQIFDAAGTVAADMQGYLEKAYREAAKNPERVKIPAEAGQAAFFKSAVYGRTLAPLNYDVENYLSESARNAVAHNEDIVGVGAMFEPHKFQSDLKDYAFYVMSGDADAAIEPFGSYETYSAEGYYKDAAAAGKVVVTDPYDFNGIKMVSYAAPVFSGSELQGVVMADLNVTNFSKVDSSSERYPSMYATINDNEGKIVFDSRSADSIGQDVNAAIPVPSELAAFQAGMAQGQAFQVVTKREDGRNVTRFMSPLQAGSEVWWSQTAVETADISRAVRNTVLLMVLISAAALLLLLLVTVSVLKSMLRPIRPVVEAAERIAGGNLDVSLSSDSGDEIGVLSRAFQKMSENLRRIVADVDQLLGEMADGNFNARTGAEDSYVGDFEGFLLSIRKLNARLSETLGQINRSADQVAAGSDQVSSGAQALSQGATEQASSVQELAATINEISVHVQQNAESAHGASEQARETAQELENGKQQMAQMTEAMDRIDKSSAEIGKIIKTIEDIAFQTNILALNAAVEAARAGAAGKGFAVVADEVRNLASKSAEASRNTSALIEATIHAVREGTSIAGETASSLGRIVLSSEKSAALVHQISSASQEQAASVAQVTQGIDQISSVVQTNSATAEESAAASEELSSQAQMLKELVSRFRLKEQAAALPEPAVPDTGARADDSAGRLPAGTGFSGGFEEY